MSKSDKSGKPELSNDELTRISKEAYSRYTGYDGTAMSIGFRQGAEWATLHERSASQARIAELEAVLKHIDIAYELVYLIDDHFRNVIASGDYVESDVENHKKATKFLRAYKKSMKP